MDSIYTALHNGRNRASIRRSRQRLRRCLRYRCWYDRAFAESIFGKDAVRKSTDADAGVVDIDATVLDRGCTLARSGMGWLIPDDDPDRASVPSYADWGKDDDSRG